MAQKRKDSRGRNLWTGETERKDGRYVFQYKDIDGSSRSVYDKTLEGLRAKEKRIQQDIADGIKTDKGNMIFGELFSEFMEMKGNEIKESTRIHYEQLHESYISTKPLNYKKISNIQNVDVKRFLIGMNNDGFSKNTIKAVHTLVASAMKYAMNNDYVRRNVAVGAMPKVDKEQKAKEPLTTAQLENLIAFCQSSIYSRYVPFITVAANTGLRVGELIGLTWSCVDKENRRLKVKRQLKYLPYGDEGYKFHFSTPKTQAGRRTIPITSETVRAFTKQQEIDMAKGTRCSISVEGVTDFVFLTREGKPYTPTGVNEFLYRIERDYNQLETALAEKENRKPSLLPHLSAHILRHSAATVLFERGIDLKSLQGLLGHADFSTTTNVYVHAQNDVEWMESELEKAGCVVSF